MHKKQTNNNKNFHFCFYGHVIGQSQSENISKLVAGDKKSYFFHRKQMFKNSF